MVLRRRGFLNLGYRIGQSRQGVRLVRLDSDDHPLIQQHLDPGSKSDHNRHRQRVGLPVAAVDPRHCASVSNDLGRSRNLGTVLAPHITRDTRIPSCSLHLVRIPRSEEFDLSSIHNEPHLYFLQFAGSPVGPEPLRVSFESAFQFWSHGTLAVILGPRLAVWQLARMLRLRTAPGPPAENPESARLTPRLGDPLHGLDTADGHHDVPPPGLHPIWPNFPSKRGE